MDAPESPPARPPAFDPAAHGWQKLERTTASSALVGPLWRHAAEPTRFGFQAEQRHNNHNGVVQGGMLMTFADRGLGYLVYEAAGGRTATISFGMDFVSGGRIGTFVELHGEVVRRTRSLVFMRGLVIGDDAAIVATCQGTWKILGR